MAASTTVKNYNASGVKTRISQGEYGNLSVAESVIDLNRHGVKENDTVTLFSLPEGVRILGLKLYSTAGITNIKAGEHELKGELTTCTGECPVTPHTVTQGQTRLVATMKTVPATGATFHCIIEYVAQGSL